MPIHDLIKQLLNFKKPSTKPGTMYTSKELLTKVISDLMKDPYLAQFKLRKYDSFLYIKEGDLRKSIELTNYSDMLDLTIRPIYGVKFGILMKWFEKFSFKTIKDQRDNSNIFYGEVDGITRGWMNKYEFRKDGKDYTKSLTMLREDLVNASRFVFDKFDSLESIFKSRVVPLLDGSRRLGPGDIGADWIFEDLRVCQLVSPKDYPKLRDILMEHFNFQKERGEPNIGLYADKIDDILAYLDHLAETGDYA